VIVPIIEHPPVSWSDLTGFFPGWVDAGGKRLSIVLLGAILGTAGWDTIVGVTQLYLTPSTTPGLRLSVRPLVAYGFCILQRQTDCDEVRHGRDIAVRPDISPHDYAGS